ncbi:hypothetical protein BJY00DRAFT_199995 [Aspergillus carlsbadensis]|nr:hypothetical protein BJY00DRAFT_199995 [Aspergillus carlsbadensis]
MALRGIIDNGQFFALPRKELLLAIYTDFATELEFLKSAYAVPANSNIPQPHAAPQSPSQPPSPSTILFEKEHDEINRTLVSIEALRMIYNDEYTRFTETQDESVRLHRDSFNWLHELFRDAVTKGPELLHTLVTSVIINDLGKSPALAMEYERAVGGPTGDSEGAQVNHDLLLHQVVQRTPQVIPCLNRLNPDRRAELELAIELGASLNFGQLAQAENVPASLVGLDCVKESRFAFALRFLEQILDVAGAAGHEDHAHAKKLIEPIFRSYKLVYDVALDYLTGGFNRSRRDAYDAVLQKKMGMLAEHGKWEAAKGLEMSKPEDRALMRLLCICNASSPAVADLVCKTFHNEIADPTRQTLIHGLNVDGAFDTPAVQATYIPAVCSAAITATKSLSRNEQRRALGAVFRYLARVLAVTKADQKGLPKDTAVIERDIRELAIPVASSPQFVADPGVLDSVDVPACAVAIRLPREAKGGDAGFWAAGRRGLFS